METCHGNGTTHCCWINGTQCPWLEENTVEGRRWVCGLYRTSGTWGRVYATPEYQNTAAAAMFSSGWPGFGCGDWPQNIPDQTASPSGKCCYQAVN